MWRMVDLRLFVFPWLVLPWILPFSVCTTLCAQHANVVSVVFTVVAAENFCFPSCATADAVVALALDTGSNVSSGQAVNWMVSKLELRQPRCHRCAHGRSCESLQWLGLGAFPECPDRSRGLDADSPVGIDALPPHQKLIY